jgi:flagellar protein FlaF
MHAAQMQAYRNVHKSTMSGRDVEAAALTNAAMKLQECQAQWEQGGHSQRLSDSLRVNQQIWTILQSELAQEDNPLPLNIRKDLLTLSVYVDKRIIDVMAYPAPEKLDTIITINLNIAAGLKGNSVGR